MSRRVKIALVIVLIALGMALIAIGLSIELDIHHLLETSPGAGLRRFIVRRFAKEREQLLNYRWFAHWCVVLGPGLLASAYLILFVGGKKDEKEQKKPKKAPDKR